MGSDRPGPRAWPGLLLLVLLARPARAAWTRAAAWAVPVVAAAAMLTLCGIAPARTEARTSSLAVPHPAPRVVEVAAASSLREVFEEVGRGYGRGGRRAEFQFAGSQMLRTQIEQGASPDVVAMVDTLHVEALRRQGLALPSRRFASTRLVIVSPARDSMVREVRDLARRGVRLVLADPAVPAGRYADQVIERVGLDPALGPGVRRGIEANVRSREISVRSVLAKVALGEADAGLVYATDLEAAPARIRSIELPPSLGVTVEYHVAVLTHGAHPAEARAFVDYLLGSGGQRVLLRHGFRN